MHNYPAHKDTRVLHDPNASQQRSRGGGTLLQKQIPCSTGCRTQANLGRCSGGVSREKKLQGSLGSHLQQDKHPSGEGRRAASALGADLRGLQLMSRGTMQIPPSPGGAATHGPPCVGLQSAVRSCPRPGTEQIPTCPQLSPARCQEQKRFLMGLTRTPLVAGDRARLLQGCGRSILGSAPAGGQQGRERFPIAAFSPACSQSGSSPHGPAPWSSPSRTGTAPAGWGHAGEGGTVAPRCRAAAAEL